MPFPGPCSPPVATYGPGLHAEMHRMANKDYHSKVLLDIFFVRLFLHDIFFKFKLLARYFFWDSTHPPHQKSNGPSLMCAGLNVSFGMTKYSNFLFYIKNFFVSKA